VSRSTVRDFECGRRALHRATEARILDALEAEGIRLLPPDGEGPGVRLRWCGQPVPGQAEAGPSRARTPRAAARPVAKQACSR